MDILKPGHNMAKVGAREQKQKIATFIAALRDYHTGINVFHPWQEQDPALDVDDAAAIRLENLSGYLSKRIDTAKVALVAEAAGYQGCRFSGVAMTSERILLGKNSVVSKSGPIDLTELRRTSRTEIDHVARTVRLDGFTEPTATVVWSEMLNLGFTDDQWVNWNCFPFHPHRNGNPLSNRKPLVKEIRPCLYLLEGFLSLFPDIHVVSIGKTAERWLKSSDLDYKVEPISVRHPANGGTNEFITALKQIQESIQ